MGDPLGPGDRVRWLGRRGRWEAGTIVELHNTVAEIQLEYDPTTFLNGKGDREWWFVYDLQRQ